MVSTRSGQWKRTMLTAVAAILPALVPAASFAGPESAKRDAQRDEDRLEDVSTKKIDPKKAKATKQLVPAPKTSPEASKKPAPTKKVEVDAKKVDAKKADAKLEVKKADPKKVDAKVAIKKGDDDTDKASKHAGGLKKIKTVASRSSSGKKKYNKTDVLKPCNGQWVNVDRGGLEPEKMPLVDCKGRPLASSQEHLSVLVRPWGAARPKIAAHEGRALPDSRGEIAPGVRLLDNGLVTRLDAIARHFPGKAFSFVSGYRPQSRGSNHQTGRAVDMRVVGVKNEELVAFCRTLRDTGCGYYPNSSFIHVDVRNPGTGSVAWIDASGPGEAPRYVSSWPPPKVHGTDPAGKDERVAPPAEDEPHDDVTADQLPKNRLGEVPDHPLL
jgi:Bacterial protein of unknown function (DUF882)